ncbi:MAG TPA: TonB family protein, partial [Campylobacterales bacterium]|nr:TonB family protein [Campylobacterales bacterium]
KIAIITPTIPPKIKPPTPPIIVPVKPKIKKVIKKQKPKPKHKTKKIIKHKKIIKKHKRVIKQQKNKPRHKTKKIIKHKKTLKQAKVVKVIEPYIEPITEKTPIPIQEKAITRPKAIKRVTPPKENLNAKKRNFLRDVRKKIYANKRYPTLAKRRHIQGRVHVVFDILANGEVANVRIDETSRILKKEVRRSIRKSSPIDVPSSIASMFPIRNISVNIDFRLQ